MLAVACLAGCGGAPLSPMVTDAAIETALPKGGERALELGKKGQLDGVPVSVSVGVSDAYGKQSQAEALQLRWSAADLAKVQWSSISKFQLLDLADLRITSRYGLQAAHAWCFGEEKLGATLTPRLCGDTYLRAVQGAKVG